MNKRAVVVEDDAQQVYFTSDILSGYGFDVTPFSCADEAKTGMVSIVRPVDLVILDRKLPQRETDEPDDAVGDRLLGELLSQLPDTAFVVFTGYTDFLHHQFATQERGVINLGEVSLDRVRAFEKSQTVEFDQYVGRVAEQIDRIGDLEIRGLYGGGADASISRRLLKMVARHYGGDSVSVRPLAGGQAEMPVWHCRIIDATGNEVASVVVKQTDGLKSTPASGLHTILPAAHVAAPVAVVSGLCDGKRAQVMQVAGTAPTSLLELLLEREQDAADHLRAIAALIDAVPAGSISTRSLDSIVEPLIAWPTLVERLTAHGIAVPRHALRASVRVSAQHGDLHSGNILQANGVPVLIDFDNEVYASRALDPVTALLSPLFHPNSPIRESEWPTPEQCTQIDKEAFLDGSPCRPWVAEAQAWVEQTITSDRERWALILGYATRQLKYKDVLDDKRVKERALSLARKAVSMLITN